MRRSAMMLLMLWIGAPVGCVERRMVIATDPPGALVLHNGTPIGNSPGDDHFIYYGIHHFTIIRPGYQTLQVDQRIRAPWYQFFPLDFVSEVLVPYQIEDVRRFTYQMQPVPATRSEDLADRASVLREKGKGIVSPPPDNPYRRRGFWGLFDRGTPGPNPPPPTSPPPPATGAALPPTAPPAAPLAPPVPPAVVPGGPTGGALTPPLLTGPS